MHLHTLPYAHYETALPQAGNWILGQEKGDDLVVYQAFNDRIADYAVRHQRFGGAAYRFERMTWIKPNFLWMMFRSGWASKPNQERILAIRMVKTGFVRLLQAGVYSSFQPHLYPSKEAWQAALAAGDVRIQWDPDHDPSGEKRTRRAVQIGIKGEALAQFNHQYIRSITDITPFVIQQREKLSGNAAALMVPIENIISLPDQLRRHYSIPAPFVPPVVQDLVDRFERTSQVSDEAARALLIGGKARKAFVQYLKNYRHPALSRYLLERFIQWRRSGEVEVRLEDLLTAGYFASKNGTATDTALLLRAKLIDFDTYAGFDGELIFYPLGYAGTRAYLQTSAPPCSPEVTRYFLNNFTPEYLYHDSNERALWYLEW